MFGSRLTSAIWPYAETMTSFTLGMGNVAGVSGASFDPGWLD